uniref:SCP domain-containing protein n=1 Tax=Strongyloides papillosus TaxID=174720 RepID=A0A0N5BQH0_STREA
MVVRTDDGIRYSYRNELYRTKDDVAEQVKKNHPTVKTQKLYLVKVAEISHYTRIIDPKNYNYESIAEHFDTKSCKVIVYEFCVYGKVYYKCFHKKFHRFEEAESYAKRKERMMSHICCYKPNHNKGKPKDLLKIVGKRSFSDKVWRSIWKTCYKHYCFSMNNFGYLKTRYVFEINMYRIAHNGKPIQQHPDLTSKAEKYLKNILDLGNNYIPNKYLDVYTKISTHMAPLLIKRWYEEEEFYRFSTEELIRKAAHFSAIVWKEVEYVGFAVHETCNSLHIVYLFYPTPNTPRGFPLNVVRRKSTLRESIRSSLGSSLKSPLGSSLKSPLRSPLRSST